MYKVYILRSISKPEKSYVGQTVKSIKDRLTEHNKGLSRFTKTYRPWQLVYFEQFYCQLCADKREQFLKSGFGYKLRKLLIENAEKLR